MTRPVWTRAMALVVGLWFVAVSAGPELTHACPAHSIHAANASVSVGHAEHGGVVAKSVVVAGHHAATDGQSTPERGSQCTCLGQCCSTPPVAFMAATIALADIVTASTGDAGLPDSTYVPVAARHVLPLAHAPPLSA